MKCHAVAFSIINFKLKIKMQFCVYSSDCLEVGKKPIAQTFLHSILSINLLGRYSTGV